MDVAQRTLDSLMADMGSDSGRTTPPGSPVEDPDASANSWGQVNASAQHLSKADHVHDPATRSELLEPEPRDSGEEEAGLSMLATPQHTAKRRNVSFGSNATFEAGVPLKVRNNLSLNPCETSASSRSRDRGR